MKKYAKKSLAKVEPASSDIGIHPDATVGPDASMDVTFATWTGKESTNAPIVGEEETQSRYASGYPELVEKLLHDKVPLRGKTVLFITIMTWFGFVSWLFLQDNDAGKLSDINGLKWFGVKVSFYSALFVIMACFIGIISWVTRKSKRSFLL